MTHHHEGTFPPARSESPYSLAPWYRAAGRGDADAEALIELDRAWCALADSIDARELAMGWQLGGPTALETDRFTQLEDDMAAIIERRPDLRLGGGR